MRRRAALAAVALAAALSPAVALAADETPPLITPSITGTAGDGGWYRSSVQVKWTVFDPDTGITPNGCDPETIDAQTDGQTVDCSAESEGGTASASKTIKIDWTPPSTPVAALERPPDAGTWFNHPLRIAFQATDALSGIAECTTLTYAGPDNAAATVEGTCRDVAGNTSAATTEPFAYDATPPALGTLRVSPGDRRVRLAWSPSADVASVEIARGAAVLYRGAAKSFTERRLRNGRRYEYVVTAVDQAGNVDRRSVATRPGRRLVAPAPGARVSAPPVLRWTAVRGTRYYNVQLFRGSRKVLTSWPRSARLALHRTWRYRGARRRLAPGRYRWYVWPGIGARNSARYGRLIGSRSFVVSAR